MASMTLEEMERRAYADGDVKHAALLALAIDCTDDRVDEARHEGYEEGFDAGVAYEKDKSD